MNPTEKDIELLRLVNVSGSVTHSEMERVFPGVDGIRSKLDKLWSFGFVRRDLNPGKATVYELSAKGRRLLVRLDRPEMGEFPAKREFVPSGAYVPAKIITRPGSQDFLACKSRRGNELVEHKLPISMAGGGE